MRPKPKFLEIFYQKYRATILLNKNLFIADTASLFVSSYFAQVYFLLSNGNFLLDSIFTAIIEYAVDTPLFFLLFYIDSRQTYKNTNHHRLRCDITRQLGLFAACDIMYVVIKVFLQYQLLTQINHIQPFAAAALSSRIAWAIYLIMINLTMKVSRIFSHGELTWYYTLVVIISLANSVIFFSNLNLDPRFDQPVIDVSAGIALTAAILVVLKRSQMKILLFRGTFMLLMLGLVFWFSAEMVFSYYQLYLKIDNPFPSIADVIWLIGYAFYIYALYKVLSGVLKSQSVRTIGKATSERHNFAAVIISIAAVLTISLTYIELSQIVNGHNPFDFTKQQRGEFESFIVSIAYPILDGVLFVPTAIIIWTLRRSSPVFTHWMFLAAFVVLNTVGDIGFAYSELINPDLASRQQWIWDTFFNSSYLCIAASLLWYSKFSLVKVAMFSWSYT